MQFILPIREFFYIATLPSLISSFLIENILSNANEFVVIWFVYFIVVMMRLMMIDRILME